MSGYWHYVDVEEAIPGIEYTIRNTQDGAGLPVYVNKPKGEKAPWKIHENGTIVILRMHLTMDGWGLVEYKGAANKDHEDVWADLRSHLFEWVNNPVPPEPEWVTVFEWGSWRLQRK